MPETQIIEQNRAPFWEHLEEMRALFIRALIALVVVTPLLFICKNELFRLILAPSKPDFILYRLFGSLGNFAPYIWLRETIQNLVGLSLPAQIEIDPIHVEMINTELASQFMIHVTTSIYVAILLTLPYIIYLLYSFVSPALKESERRYSAAIITLTVALFLCGIALNYLILFPLSFRFLANYQVSHEVVNMFSLSSYISVFMTMSIMMGLVFEIPVLTLLLAKFGLIKAEMLRRYRRHAFVISMTAAALITPTGDIVTLALVTAPIYLLYELSVKIIPRR